MYIPVKYRDKSALSYRFYFFTIIAIILLIIIIHGKTLHYEFVNWDDPDMVLNNPNIKSLSPQAILNLFRPAKVRYFFPVTDLSYALDFFIWGLSPMGFHLTNVVLHGLSAVILLLLLCRILPDIIPEPAQPFIRFISFFTVLLFVVHPVNIEPVAWITARRYGLWAVFGFSFIYFLLKHQEKDLKGYRYYLLSLFLLLLALLSNPQAITLPFLYLGYDFLKHRSITLLKYFKQRLIYQLPFIALSFLMSIIQIRIYASGKTSIVQKGYDIYFNENLFFKVFIILFEYLKNLILPLWLNNKYIINNSISFYHYKIFFTLSLLIIIFSLSAKKYINKEPFILFCLAWFFISLLPVLGLVPSPTQMADRYLYIPSVSLFLLLNYALVRLVQSSHFLTYKMGMLYAFTVALILFYSIISIYRSDVWSNSQTLWEDSLAKNPKNSIAHNNLGVALKNKGHFEKAMDHFQKTIKLHPAHKKVYYNIGEIFFNQQQYNQAISYYTKALELNQKWAPIPHKLGVCLLHLNQPDKAILYLTKAIKLNHHFASAHYNMGIGLWQLNRPDEALQSFMKAIELKPDYDKAMFNIGVVLASKGDLNKAYQSFSDALKINPNLVDAQKAMKAIESRVQQNLK